MAPRFRSGEGPELTAALEHLYRADPDMRRAREIAGALPDRKRDPGLKALMRLIVEQQLSVASAAAIWGRIEAATKPFGARRFLEHDDDALRAMGLSRQKVLYCRHLAEAVHKGHLPIRRLAAMPDDEAMDALIAVKGIGRWTAEVYLLFALGRDDIFPAGDLALQVAVQDLKQLDARPSEKALVRMAEDWRPHRGTAARLLWRYYGVVRRRADPVTVD